ncbi:MAG: LacI family DNA-binding transcriptional regulator [Roseiflexaceae bacterium]
MAINKSITIHDIAREAGVSPSTVSRVLNGTTPVAESKRVAVMAAVNSLQYRPSVIAQGLARGRTAVIGVLTQDIASPFYGEILKGIERGLAGSGYHPMFASGNWRVDDEHAALEMLQGRQVDALILMAGQLSDEDLRRTAERTPLVVLGRLVPGLEEYCLRVDDRQGAYRATQYLIGLGHRRIAHITGLLSHQDAAERRAGYLEALHDAGLETDPELIVEGDFSERSGLLAVDTLLRRSSRVTAIFAANDQIAYGARLGLFRRGIRVPEDLSLVGFDDQPGTAYATPPLTTVRQPTLEMGRAAAQTVLRLLEGLPLDLPTFATELVIRESAAMVR